MNKVRKHTSSHVKDSQYRELSQESHHAMCADFVVDEDMSDEELLKISEEKEPRKCAEQR